MGMIERVAARLAGVAGDMTDEQTAESEKILARSEKAAGEAGAWHQGSGTHADACHSLAETHVEMAGEARAAENLAAAELWALAAEAEAAYLKEGGGSWPSQGAWLKGPSGQATKAAKKASRALGLNPADFDV